MAALVELFPTRAGHTRDGVPDGEHAVFAGQLLDVSDAESPDITT